MGDNVQGMGGWMIGRRDSLECDADNTYRGWEGDDLGCRRSLSLEWDADNKYWRGWEGG